MRFLTVLTALVLIGLAGSATARDPVMLGDWGKLTLPDDYEPGKPFDVTVEVLKLDAPSKLTITANWKKTGGQFGGFLQLLGASKDISGPGTHTFTVKIDKTKPEMGSAVITAYLSPDGEWKTQTANGSADIKTKAKAGVAPEDIGTISVKTKKAPLLVLKDAPKLPSLKEAGLTEEPAFVDEFEPNWPKKDAWQVATWKQNGTQMSPDRCRVDAQGHLVQTVLAGKPFSGGSVQSTKEFGYGRWVARLKPTSTPGVLNSMFTKNWDDMTTPAKDDGDGGEIDIELLSHTYEPGKGEVHLAIHLKGHPAVFQVDVPLDFNPSDDFHEWGFDVLPDRVVWHVDGRIVHEWKYTKELSITPGYEMFFNSWTMEKWIKGPPKEQGDYRIDWVKFYPVAKDVAKPQE